MWLFLPYGFFSICQHPEVADKMFIRARRREHLGYAQRSCKALHDLYIIEQSTSDYRWRVIASREQVAAFLVQAMSDVVSDNFKDSAHEMEREKVALPDHHQYTSMLHRVWHEHFKLQRR